MFMSVLAAVLTMLVMACALSTALVVANAKLTVPVDPRRQALESLLPQANCGGCGYASCSAYAKAIHEGQASLDQCTVGGPGVAQQLATTMGVELGVSFPVRPVIHCSATASQRLGRGNYRGESRCASANVVGGVQGCVYGCLGFGDCVDACEYAAMEMVDGLPRILYDNCVGCGACVRACPRDLIEQIPFQSDRMLVVGCANHDSGKLVREVCQVGCIGCGLCARQRPEMVSMQDHLAAIDYENYASNDDYEPLVEKCPMESLVILGNPPPRQRDESSDRESTERVGRPSPRPSQSEAIHWRG